MLPKSTRCTICSHAQAAEINRCLGKERGSRRALAVRFGVGESALQRHRKGCLGIEIAPKTAETSGGKPQASSSSAESGRFADLDSKALVGATARLVDEALDLLEHAKKADDRKTALAALREARDGLSVLMRVAGMLAPDGATTINVDSRRQSIALVAKLTTEELRALAYGEPIDVESRALTDGTAQDDVPALPAAPENA
jgi:hypothetical protein